MSLIYLSEYVDDVSGNIDVKTSSVMYPVGGTVTQEHIDPDIPEVRECNEIMRELSKHRRPSEKLVQECRRRIERLTQMLNRRMMSGVSRYN